MNPLTRLLDSSIRFETQYAEHLLNRFRYLSYPGARIPVETEWVEPRGMRAALAASARLVVTGAAGTGKTTLLTALAITYARQVRVTPRTALPLYFSARELQTLPRITDLPRGLNLRDDLAAQCPRIFFADVFSGGRARVLIDDADGLAPEHLQAILREYKDAHIIATAQTALPGFDEFALPGFRDGDLELFARNLNTPHAATFLAALRANNVPRTLTANPMTFGLLAHIWRSDQALPTDRTQLFEQYAQGILGDNDETAKVLETIALALQQGGVASNEYLARGRGFLRAGKNRTADFVHELWQAYFAARALRAANTPLWRDHLDDPAWRETILFYAGLGDAEPLVTELLTRGDPSFAGLVVAHAREAHAEWRETITRKLVALAWAGDANAIAALAQMQSDSAVDGFAAQLKMQDPAVRMRAAHILGALQLDRGIEYLLPQLRDLNPDVRDQVVAALGNARTDRVIEPLLVALRGDPRGGAVDTRMRVAAARALGMIASDKALPALVVDLQIGEPPVRAVAAEALKRLPSPLLSAPLTGLLRAEDAAVRQAAADVLAVLNGTH